MRAFHGGSGALRDRVEAFRGLIFRLRAPLAYEGEHDGVVRDPVQQKPFPEDPLPHGAGFLRRPEARHVLRRNDQFEPDEIRVLERPVDDLADGGRRHPAPGGRGTNPVPQVGAPVRAIDLVQAAAPEVSAAFRQNGELERRACLERLDLGLEPGPDLLDRQLGMAPRQEGTDLGYGGQGGLVEHRSVFDFVGSEGDVHFEDPLMQALVKLGCAEVAGRNQATDGGRDGQIGQGELWWDSRPVRPHSEEGCGRGS